MNVTRGDVDDIIVLAMMSALLPIEAASLM